MKSSLSKKLAEPFIWLFWKAQITALRCCPPFCAVVSSLSIGAANSRKLWIKTLLRLAVQGPCAVTVHVRNTLAKHVVLSRVTFAITERCTLNCEKCAAHIPQRKARSDISLDELSQDIQTMLACVDHVDIVYFSGGETFLHPNLDQMIQLCADSGKVGSINILTNGTVIPNAKMLNTLQEAHAAVRISKYAATLQPDVETLKELLKESGICYTHESGAAWSDMNGSDQLKKGSAKRRFSVCVNQLCALCYYGKLHLCGESAYLMREGQIPDCEEDYINLRTIKPAEFRGQWRKLLKKRVISACSYCLGDTYKTPKIPVAVQCEPPQK